MYQMRKGNKMLVLLTMQWSILSYVWTLKISW